MNIRQSVNGGLVVALCYGLLLGAMSLPAQAGDGSMQLVKRKNFPPENVRPGPPQGERPLYSPPPFIDRSPPMSERPLAPIGSGTPAAPQPSPFVWCQGKWVRVENPWHSCPSH